MRILTIYFCIISLHLFAQKQQPFIGKLLYSVSSCDTSLQKSMKPSFMTIYTNDTLIRIENNSSVLGNQTLIKHLELNKSYLLINSPIGKVALQSSQIGQTTDSLNYQFTLKSGRKKIGGIRGKKLLVYFKKSNQNFTFYYTNTINSKYLNNFISFPGLPILYYLSTPEGIFKYELKEIQYYLPSKDLFGIPKDYKKMSFDQFIDSIEPAQKN